MWVDQDPPAIGSVFPSYQHRIDLLDVPVEDFSFDDKPNLFQRFRMPPGHRPMEMAEVLTG